MSDKRKNKSSEWRRNIGLSLRGKSRKVSKEDTRQENLAALGLGGYVGANVFLRRLPNQKDVTRVNKKLQDVFVNKSLYEDEVKTNPVFKKITEQEEAAKNFLNNRKKYESAVNTTDSTPEMRAKAGERFKKKFGPDIADPKIAAQKEAFLKQANSLKQKAVIQKELGSKLPSKALKTAVVAGLGTAATVKALKVIKRKQDDKKAKKG